MTDKRTSKKPASKRALSNAVRENATAGLAEVDSACLEVDTPPASATSSWVSLPGHNRPESCVSPIDSVVGSPRVLLKAKRAEEYKVQERLMRGVWSSTICDADDSEAGASQHMAAALPMLLHIHDDEACCPQQAAKAERSMEDCDDMMASVLGHMSEVTDLEEMSSDVSVVDLGWSGQGDDSSCLPSLDAMLDEAEYRAHQHPESREVDEVEWLRRTYETVYNPTARQRALDQLLATPSVSKRAAYKPAPPAARSTKSTILYDFV